MATYRRDDWVAASYRGQECFYCGCSVADEAIVAWRGHGPNHPDIVLHCGCAAELGAHLIKDSFGITQRWIPGSDGVHVDRIHRCARHATD